MTNKKIKKPAIDNLEVAPGFGRAMAFHRAWLKHHGLLDRPWFVLGSAPGPSMPPLGALPHDTVYAYVKFAGRSARQHGFPDGDITLATGFNEGRWDDLKLRQVLRVHNKSNWRDVVARLLRRPSDTECQLYSRERDDYVLSTMQSRFRGVGQHVRPSSALTLVAFAVAHGVPEIVIAGLSLDRTGHAYNDLNAQRKHAAEDRAALTAIARLHPHVRTTEPSLAEATGLPLFPADGAQRL